MNRVADKDDFVVWQAVPQRLAAAYSLALRVLVDFERNFLRLAVDEAGRSGGAWGRLSGRRRRPRTAP
jgi:hypothetical protein